MSGNISQYNLYTIQTFYQIMTLIFKDKENNEEWNRCLDSNSLIWGRCIYDCGGNDECKGICVDEFEKNLLNCPCEVPK